MYKRQVQISKIFEETAANEKEHAKLWFKLLNGGKVGPTLENLKDAAAGENYEWTDMYAVSYTHLDVYKRQGYRWLREEQIESGS